MYRLRQMPLGNQAASGELLDQPEEVWGIITQLNKSLRRAEREEV